MDAIPPTLPMILSTLNPEQLTAVTFDPNSRLQIIAGPGTGKTKLITSRVAYLLLKFCLDPSEVIVTTFTKKAANEMLERLRNMLEHTEIDLGRLFIGTFHSICLRILKKYGSAIGLGRFTIADDRDSAELMKRALQEFKHRKSKGNEIKIEKDEGKGYLRRISSLKSNCVTHQSFTDSDPDLASIYSSYQDQLQRNNMLDFDDILLNTYTLLTARPGILRKVKHVLVDEFQDTNLIQLHLMRLFSGAEVIDVEQEVYSGAGNVTVVGDPNQSIYGFRDALSDGKNFQIMCSAERGFYSDVQVVKLQENYRSTKDVLGLSEALLKQADTSDFLTQLNSQMDVSFPCVYNSELCDNSAEAKWIANQIRFLTKEIPLDGSSFSQKAPSLPALFPNASIAILLRASYQSRVIETQLLQSRIPYTIIKGRAFWERKEVLMMLDYLKVVASVAAGTLNQLSFLRTVNFPVRGIGAKTLAKLEEQLQDGSELGSGMPKAIQSGMVAYFEVIYEAVRVLNDRPKGLVDLQKHNALKVFDYVYVQSGMKQHYEKEDNGQERELNVMEVRKHMEEFSPLTEIDIFEDKLKDSDQPLGESESEESFLDSFFLSLNIFNETKADGDETPKVSISTIHASKGLEWDVVFIPNLIDTILPARWALNPKTEAEKTDPTTAVNEERRIFYVAVTRARRLLYLSAYKTEERGFFSKADSKPNPVAKSRFMGTLAGRCAKQQTALMDVKALKSLMGLVGYTHHQVTEVSNEYEKAAQIEHALAKFVDGYKAYARSCVPVVVQKFGGFSTPPVPLRLMSNAPKFAPGTETTKVTLSHSRKIPCPNPPDEAASVSVPRLPPLAERTRGKRLGMGRRYIVRQ